MAGRKMIARTSVAILVVMGTVISVWMSGAVQANKAARRSDVSASSTTAEKIVLEYDFSEPDVSQQAGYDVVQIEGLESYKRVGAPIVPVRPVTVLIPFGKKVKATNVTLLETHELPGTYKLMPGQKSYPYSYEGPIERTEPDPAIYGKAEPWPGINCKGVGTQSKRGYQIFIVNLFPVQYRPLKGEISYATKMRLEITLGVSEKKAVLRPTRNVKDKIKADVDNSSALGTYETDKGSGQDKDTGIESSGGMMTMEWSPGGPNSPLEDPSFSPYYGVGDANYTYVVITSEGLADPNSYDSNDPNKDPNYNFQALCDSKWDRGISACIVDTNWIYANYDPNEYDPNNYDPCNPNSNNATSIRMFLMDAYQTWGTEYCLLGGDKDIIPVRYFYNNLNIPCDMYYGCVEPNGCTFNYDANDKWGEPNDGVGGGEVDMWAEIYVGRAAVEDANEVVNLVRKTLTYNTTNNGYLPRVAMLGEYAGCSIYTKDMLEQIRLGGTYDGYFTYGFENSEYSEFFVTEGCMPGDPNAHWPLYEKDENWDVNDWLALANGGMAVFDHSGHGSKQCMSSGYDICNDCIESELQNTDYFFAYSHACYPGSFDGYDQYGPGQYGYDSNDCFAEVVTTMKEGAFAAVMNSRMGWFDCYNETTDGPSHRFNRQFWDAVLGEDMPELGRANQDSKEDNYWDIDGVKIRYCYYELNLFGDPELRFHIYPIYNATQDLYYETIQDAIDDANNEDEIVVPKGIHYESIDFNSVTCTLRSTNPDDWEVVAATVIDANGAAKTVEMDSNAVLSGLTITGGTYGVYCDDDSPVISKCTIRGNDTGVEYRQNSTGTLISQCIINDNTSYGIFGQQGNATIKNNWIYENDKGMKLHNASADINNNTVANNDTYGIEKSGGQGQVTISNCIVWDNDDDLSGCSATYSCIKDGDTGTGNISSDPCFVTPGVISHWRFNEGSGTTANDSAGDNDGNITGDPNWVTGKVGSYALDFDGSGDYVVISNESNFDFGTDTDFTICAWIKTTATTVRRRIVNKSESGHSPYTGIEFFMDHPGIVKFRLKDTADAVIVETTTSVNDGFWHFVAGVADRDGDIKIYHNGSLEDSDSLALVDNINNDIPLAIGRSMDYNGQYFDGTIDDVQIYGRALSATEVEELYNLGSNPNNKRCTFHLGANSPCIDAGDPNGDYSGETDIDGEMRVMCGRVDMGADETACYPVSHWEFDEGSGSTAYDSVGDNDGNITGASWTSGQINGALDFDGDGDWVNLGTDIFSEATFESSGGTLSAWVYPTSALANRDHVIGIEGRFTIEESAASTNYWSTIIYDGDLQRVESTSTIELSEWVHLAATWDTTTLEFYVNGVSQGSVNQGTPLIDPVSRPVTIGALYDGALYYTIPAIIDDVRIYDGALSAGEILQLCAEGFGGRAFNPNPDDGQTQVDPNVILSWSPNPWAADMNGHDVYFGTDYNDVNDATTASAEYMGRQDTNSWDVNNYDMNGLDYDSAYYWRIDEVNNSNLWKGNVWSFTTWPEPNTEANFVSWWKFDEGSGSTAYDSVGDNDGNITGASWTTGQIDGALDFDGSGDYVEISNEPNFDFGSDTDFTVCAWIKTTATTDRRRIVNKCESGHSPYTGFSFYMDPPGIVKFRLKDTADVVIVETTTSVNDGFWHFVAGVADRDGDIKIYHNGSPEDSDSLAPVDNINNDIPLAVGRSMDYNGQYFDGIIDDVRIYDRALSGGDIWQLYQDGL